MYLILPDALSLDPELIDASPSGLCTSRMGLADVGGVIDVSGFSICIWNVICIAFNVMLKWIKSKHKEKINYRRHVDFILLKIKSRW